MVEYNSLISKCFSEDARNLTLAFPATLGVALCNLAEAHYANGVPQNLDVSRLLACIN